MAESNPEYKINLNFPPSTAPNIFINASDNATGVNVSNYSFHVGYSPQFFQPTFAASDWSQQSPPGPGVCSQPFNAAGYGSMPAFHHPVLCHPAQFLASQALPPKTPVETCLRCEKWKRRLQKFQKLFRILCQIIMMISGVGFVIKIWDIYCFQEHIESRLTDVNVSPGTFRGGFQARSK